MRDPCRDVMVNRLVRERDEVRALLASVRDGISWCQAVLEADDTDCRKQDNLQDFLRAIALELDDQDYAA